MMHHTDTAAWVLNVIKMKKLLSRWGEHTLSSRLSNSMSRSQTRVLQMAVMSSAWTSNHSCAIAESREMRKAFNIFNNIVTLLREAETHDKISSLLLDWRFDVFCFNLRNEENSDDSNDEDYVPIRPTKKKKKKNYKCGHCGVKNDHYITTCPKKKAIEERNANFVSAMSAAMGLDELD